MKNFNAITLFILCLAGAANAQPAGLNAAHAFEFRQSKFDKTLPIAQHEVVASTIVHLNSQGFTWSNIPKGDDLTTGMPQAQVFALDPPNDVAWASKWRVNVWAHDKENGEWEFVYEVPLDEGHYIRFNATQYNAVRVSFLHVDQGDHPDHPLRSGLDPDGNGIPGNQDVGADKDKFGGAFDAAPGGDKDGGIDLDGDGDADILDEDGDGISDDVDPDFSDTGFKCIDEFISENADHDFFQNLLFDQSGTDSSAVVMPVDLPGGGAGEVRLDFDTSGGSSLNTAVSNLRDLVFAASIFGSFVWFGLSLLDMLRTM